MVSLGSRVLTTHVLEIVERLCSHVAIINRGQLVAHGSLDELRAGVRARIAATTHDDGSDPVHQSDTLTLEQIFLSVVGTTEAPSHTEAELAWLG